MHVYAPRGGMFTYTNTRQEGTMSNGTSLITVRSPKMSTYLALAAASVLSIVLGVGQGLVVLVGLAGSQLGRVGGLGCFTGLGLGVGPGVLLALQPLIVLSAV